VVGGSPVLQPSTRWQAERGSAHAIRGISAKVEKRVLAAAAAYERLDGTSFAMRQVLPAAREIVEPNERIVLSEPRYGARAGAARKSPCWNPIQRRASEVAQTMALSMY
jgi:uncharacterized protein (DUF1778 family)